MTEIRDRYYHIQDEICAGRPPELMKVDELAASYGRLSEKLQQKKAELTDTADEVVRIVEWLSGSGERWLTRAVLLSLEDNIRTLDSGSRDAVLSYLLDMMFYGKRSAKKIAAQAAGRIIAAVCESDMSVWSDTLRRILFMKNGDSSDSRSLSEDPLRVILITVCENVSAKTRKAVLSNYASYFKSTRWDSFSCLRLLSGIFTVPVSEWGAMQRGNIGGFIRYFLKQDDTEVRIAALYLLNEWLEQGWSPSEDFSGFLIKAFIDIYEKDRDTISPAANELIREICDRTGHSQDVSCNPAPSDRELFSSNMREDQSWIFKLVNLRILKKRYMDSDPEDPGFEAYISELMILLRLNPDEIVFRRAGEDILDLTDRISRQQKYEFAKELLKVLETGYDETGYVPDYLGRFYPKLDMDSRFELFGEIQNLISGSQSSAAGSTLEAVCCTLKVLAEDRNKSDENFRLVQKLCGLLSQSMYSDMTDMVSRVLFSVGCDLFARLDLETSLKDERINDCYGDVARDALICMKYSVYPDILFHTIPVSRAAVFLNKLSAVFKEPDRPVAFFSSSFDPFSAGHRAIVREIADMGYQVYVNVHNFARNRNMQPLLIRRQIAALSVTDITHVQLFPEEISINTENPEDLIRLKEMFPGQKVWLVIGSDRIENDEIYNLPPYEGSVHSYPHIIFVRNAASDLYDPEDLKRNLTGEVIILTLPVYYEHMTSKEILKNIQEGKSIDGLVGRQIRNFIERHNLYSDNRMYKPDVVLEKVETELVSDRCSIYSLNGENREALGHIYFHDILNDADEKGTVLDRFEVLSDQEAYAEILLDETLIALQGSEWSFFEAAEGSIPEDMLIRRGFVRSEDGSSFTVRADSPVVLFTDVTSNIVDSFDDDNSIMETARENAKKLQMAASGLFPGNLLLTIHSELLNYRLSEMIRSLCSMNGNNRICVPFGKILRYVSIPDVTMMPLDTEKRYNHEITNFTITEKSGTPALASQIRQIRSKDMPIVLVDDLYHKGYRMDRITESLKEEGMKEDYLIVGVMSDKGRNMASDKNINVKAVYDIPGLKLWINASDMVPFFGSDKIDPGTVQAARVTEDYPSLYPMLPYQFPSFLKEAHYEAVYRLSEVCMENAVRLFDILEKLYREKYHRTLTYSRLSEVIDETGYPEDIPDPEIIRKETVTDLLKKEKLKLTRLKRSR